MKYIAYIFSCLMLASYVSYQNLHISNHYIAETLILSSTTPHDETKKDFEVRLSGDEAYDIISNMQIRNITNQITEKRPLPYGYRLLSSSGNTVFYCTFSNKLVRFHGSEAELHPDSYKELRPHLAPRP